MGKKRISEVIDLGLKQKSFESFSFLRKALAEKSSEVDLKVDQLVLMNIENIRIESEEGLIYISGDREETEEEIAERMEREKRIMELGKKMNEKKREDEIAKLKETIKLGEEAKIKLSSLIKE